MTDILDDILPPDPDLPEWMVDYIGRKSQAQNNFETENMESAGAWDDNYYIEELMEMLNSVEPSS